MRTQRNTSGSSDGCFDRSSDGSEGGSLNRWWAACVMVIGCSPESARDGSRRDTPSAASRLARRISQARFDDHPCVTGSRRCLACDAHSMWSAAACRSVSAILRPIVPVSTARITSGLKRVRCSKWCARPGCRPRRRATTFTSSPVARSSSCSANACPIARTRCGAGSGRRCAPSRGVRSRPSGATIAPRVARRPYLPLIATANLSLSRIGAGLPSCPISRSTSTTGSCRQRRDRGAERVGAAVVRADMARAEVPSAEPIGTDVVGCDAGADGIGLSPCCSAHARICSTPTTTSTSFGPTTTRSTTSRTQRSRTSGSKASSTSPWAASSRSSTSARTRSSIRVALMLLMVHAAYP